MTKYQAQHTITTINKKKGAKNYMRERVGVVRVLITMNCNTRLRELKTAFS